MEILMGKNQIDILDILLVLAKHKRFIFWTVLIVSIVSVAYVLLSSEMWVSTATILPAQDDSNSFSLDGGSSLLGLGSSLLGGSFNTSGMDLIMIMNSKKFSQDVIDKFNLVDYMELENPDSLVVKEFAMKGFREEIRSIGIDEETGLIAISIETKDKFLSTEIANYHCEKLEKYNLENRMSKGKQKRIFLEKRVNDVKAAIDSLALQLMLFQQENNIIELENQTNLIVQLYSELIAQKTKKEIELEFSQAMTDPDSPIIKKLLKEKQIIENKISEMEEKKSSDNKYILSLEGLPEKAFEYTMIKLNLEIQKKVFTFVYPQFESAKIEEIKDLPTIEIIDKATPSGLRSKPKRARFCVLAFIFAFILSSVTVSIYDILSNNKFSEKITAIKKELFRL
jgi:capsule polysaccharide export protein KpsE/RkpR